MLRNEQSSMLAYIMSSGAFKGAALAGIILILATGPSGRRTVSTLVTRTFDGS
jgi:hypothetical protein